MAISPRKNPYPGGYEIYNCGIPFLDHYHYTLSLSCHRVEKTIFKEIVLFYFMTYMATL